MRGIYAIVMLTAVTSALPARDIWNGQKGDSVKVHQSDSNAELLDYIHDIFEKTCHNLCLKRFPKDGPQQDKCMKICHREHPDSSHEDMDKEMGEEMDN